MKVTFESSDHSKKTVANLAAVFLYFSGVGDGPFVVKGDHAKPGATLRGKSEFNPKTVIFLRKTHGS